MRIAVELMTEQLMAIVLTVAEHVVWVYTCEVGKLMTRLSE